MSVFDCVQRTRVLARARSEHAAIGVYESVFWLIGQAFLSWGKIEIARRPPRAFPSVCCQNQLPLLLWRFSLPFIFVRHSGPRVPSPRRVVMFTRGSLSWISRVTNFVLRLLLHKLVFWPRDHRWFCQELAHVLYRLSSYSCSRCNARICDICISCCFGKRKKRKNLAK